MTIQEKLNFFKRIVLAPLVEFVEHVRFIPEFCFKPMKMMKKCTKMISSDFLRLVA